MRLSQIVTMVLAVASIAHAEDQSEAWVTFQELRNVKRQFLEIANNQPIPSTFGMSNSEMDWSMGYRNKLSANGTYWTKAFLGAGPDPKHVSIDAVLGAYKYFAGETNTLASDLPVQFEYHASMNASDTSRCNHAVTLDWNLRHLVTEEKKVNSSEIAKPVSFQGTDCTFLAQPIVALAYSARMMKMFDRYGAQVFGAKRWSAARDHLLSDNKLKGLPELTSTFDNGYPTQNFCPSRKDSPPSTVTAQAGRESGG